MPIQLKNGGVVLVVSDAGERYRSSRFDWCGQVVSLRYEGIEIASSEKSGAEQDDTRYGKGFQGEFGIKRAVGFDDCPMGDYYPKIGVGWLVKDAETYDFYSPHENEAHQFKVSSDSSSARFVCESGERRGYAYCYEKVVSALPGGFEVLYRLENSGSKPFVTDEYCHNFIAPEPIGPGVEIEMGFDADERKFSERVNPEGAANWDGGKLRFLNRPTREYYYGGIYEAGKGLLCGNAAWTARFPGGILISESLEGPLARCALWGAGHVISPELFVAIELPPGEAMSWKRSYSIRLEQERRTRL